MLTACGYHLRGAFDLPEALKKIYIKGGSPELSAAIARTFRSAKGTVVATVTEANIILHVLSEHYQKRTVSLSTRGYSNEYELIYRLTFDLLHSEGHKMVSNQSIEVRELYNNSQRSESLLSKDNEEIILRQELYAEAVRSIAQRIQAQSKQKHP